MNTRKIKEIIKFDLEKSIQNKWFVILNVVIFIGILIATNISNITKFLDDNNLNFMSKDPFKIEVVDNENIFYDDLAKAFSTYENVTVEKVEKNSYTRENVPEDTTILVEVLTDSKTIISAKIVSKESIDDSIYNVIYDQLTNTRSKVFANKNGISIEELNLLNEELNVKNELLGVDAENSETKEMIKMFSVIAVYTVLLIVLSRITNEIAQEKVSKSIEYVLTSVSEKEYLLAKVLSSTFTVLVQLMYTAVYYMIGNCISSIISAAGTAGSTATFMGGIDTSIISYVLVMCGYLIFTIFLTTLIQAALASKTTSVSEAGNTMMFLMIVVVALYIISLSAISPYTTVTPFMYVVSCIPIVSTFFVPAMMIIGQATTAQIIISFVVLILSIPLVFNICAKVFKNGILDYTSTKKKKGLFAFKAAKKEELNIRQKQEIELRKAKVKKFAFTIGLAMIISIIIQAILAFVLGLILPNLLNKISLPTAIVLENSICIIASLSLTALFIKAYLGDDNKANPVKITGKQKFEIIFSGIAILALIQVVLKYVYSKVGLDNTIFDMIDITPGKGLGAKLIFVFGMALVPAIFEEILFRKVLLNSSKRFGNVFAIIFSSLIFGLYHMNANQGIFAFLIGILFGVIVIKTNSIKLTVLLHFLNNWYACMLIIAEENSVIYNMFNNVVIAISIFGGIILLKNLPKLKNIKKEDLKINKDCKFLLHNYTFIVSMILMVVMFVATQKMIG